MSTAAVDATLFERVDALWIAPGSPYKDLEQTLWAIREARERGVPCLGTCGGFQHMVLEYARHVLGFRDAQHAEYDPYASRLFVTQLACSLAGRAMRLAFAPGSQVAAIYGAPGATEAYYCDFGVNPEYVPLLATGPLPRARRASSSCPAIPSSSARSLSPRPGRRRSGRIRW